MITGAFCVLRGGAWRVTFIPATREEISQLRGRVWLTEDDMSKPHWLKD